MNYRIEKDMLGEIKVPSDVYWGANTQRAILNFQISGKNGALDHLLDIGLSTGQILGILVYGRMLGGGSGGNVLFLVDKKKKDIYQSWKKRVVNEYHKWIESGNLKGKVIRASIIEPKFCEGIQIFPQ